MCGIAGFLRLSGIGHRNEFITFFSHVAWQSLKRGPDAMGSVSFDVDGERNPVKTGYDIKPPTGDIHAFDLLHAMIANSRSGLSINFRGIPTNEQYGHDRLAPDEIQPFLVEDISVAHNGLLSNDRELAADRNWKRLTSHGDHDIDSYAFIQIVDDEGLDAAIALVKGSFAVALIDHNFSKIMLARTFLGLHLAVAEFGETRYLCWSSEPFPPIPTVPISRYFTFEMPPYSFLKLDMIKLLRVYAKAPLRELASVLRDSVKRISQPDEDKAVVICSGGLDSTVVAKLACDMDYKEVHLLHFLYGARAQKKESSAVMMIADYLRARFRGKIRIYDQYIDLSYLKTLGGSTLTEHHLEVASGELGIETAHEWVPARNLVMAAMAAAYCDRHDIGTIMLGTNREESAVYADNSSEFHVALSKALALCTQSRPRIVAPLENMMKAHIYKAALTCAAPIHLSWSCYHGGEQSNGLHCGRCGPCQLRRVAAQMTGVAHDYISYYTDQPSSDARTPDVQSGPD